MDQISEAYRSTRASHARLSPSLALATRSATTEESRAGRASPLSRPPDDACGISFIVILSSRDAEKEIATEQRFPVLTTSSSRPPLQCPLHRALHRPPHEAGETAVAPSPHHPETAGTASARTT